MAHDFVSNVDALRVDLRQFLLSPERWRTSRVATPINWKYVDFTAANQNLIPEVAGVYAFIVRHSNNHFPDHGFIMYVGITGSKGGKGKKRTLRKRYGEYLLEQKKDKRPKVHYMLNKYLDDLRFAYATFPDEKIDLAKLELDLNDAILPPAVVQDFTAEIRRHVRAMT